MMAARWVEAGWVGEGAGVTGAAERWRGGHVVGGAGVVAVPVQSLLDKGRAYSNDRVVP